MTYNFFLNIWGCLTIIMRFPHHMRVPHPIRLPHYMRLAPHKRRPHLMGLPHYMRLPRYIKLPHHMRRLQDMRLPHELRLTHHMMLYCHIWGWLNLWGCLTIWGCVTIWGCLIWGSVLLSIIYLRNMKEWKEKCSVRFMYMGSKHPPTNPIVQPYCICIWKPRNKVFWVIYLYNFSIIWYLRCI